jgi:O-antigen/teichoic acid export membrane protein
LSYLFTYNRSLLIADQKSYLTSGNDFAFYLVVFLLQLPILVFTRSFVFYLVVQIVGTLAGNLNLTRIVRKNYPLARSGEVLPLDKPTINVLWENVGGQVISRFTGSAVSNADSVLISSIAGLSFVGIYSNYALITMMVKNLLQTVLSSITASVGSLGVEQDIAKNNRTYERINFVGFSFAFFVIVGMAGALNPFIRVWLGDGYMLPGGTVALILVNLALLLYRMPNWVFINGYGLIWLTKGKQIAEIVSKVVFTTGAVLVLDIGVNGVLFATSLSWFTTASWMEPYVVWKHALNRGFGSYLRQSAVFIGVMAATAAAVWWLGTLVSSSPWVELVYGGMSALVVASCVYVLVFGRRSEFRFLLGFVRRLVFRHKEENAHAAGI